MHQPVLPEIFLFILLRPATLVNASQPFLRVRINLECSALMSVCFLKVFMQFIYNVTSKNVMTESRRSTNCHVFRKRTDLHI
jgi:hypothetical protein